MRRVTKLSDTLRENNESKLVIAVTLDYMFNNPRIAYVFADGHLLEIVFEDVG